MNKLAFSSALLATLATLATANLASAATLSQVSSIPTADILLSRGDGAGLGGGSSQATFGYRNADASGTEDTRGRGQSFVINSTVGATYAISSLTVALAGGAGTTVRPDGDLLLTVFQYTGLGATAADQIDDFSDWVTHSGGASGTQVYNGSFAIAAGTAFSASNFLTITFGSGELQLVDDTAYGFFFQYVLDSVTGLSTDVTIAFDADLGTAGAVPHGMLLNTDAGGANGVSDTRDLNYFITGTVVPEPSSLALLGLGSLALLRRRRK